MDEEAKAQTEPTLEQLKSRPKVKIEDQDVPSYYTNSIEFMKSIYDFRLQLRQVISATPEKLIYRELANVYMSPQHAKALSRVLAKEIEDYEARWGFIPETSQE